MKRISHILVVLFLILSVFFLILGLKEMHPYQEEKTESKALKQLVIEDAETEARKGEEEEKSPFDRIIDFQALKKLNAEIVAWLYVPGTHIDYPVLIGETDSEYLKKNFKGKRSSLGSVFSFADTEKDLSEAHLCFFAHNMKSPRMFGELKKYKKHSFLKKHHKLYLYTQESITEYQVFSVYECEKTDPTFAHKMQKNSQEFLKLYERMKEKNMYQKERSFENHEDKQIITLSCCSDYHRTRNRMTVHFLETTRKNLWE